MKKAVLDALKAAREENRSGELVTLGQQIRGVFNKCVGGVDVFGTDQEWSDGLLHTVIDLNGVAVMYHIGGTLRRVGDLDGGRIYYEIIGGAGRAFKFMPHLELEPVGKDEFFGVGFPYHARVLAFSKVTGGTVARVRADVQPKFSIDAISRVTADGIEDVRIFHCGGELIDKVQLLFEELVSDIGGEWERVFRLLNT